MKESVAHSAFETSTLRPNHLTSRGWIATNQVRAPTVATTSGKSPEKEMRLRPHSADTPRKYPYTIFPDISPPGMMEGTQWKS